MTPVVVDASVAVKWFFRNRDDEADIDAALDLLRAVGDGRAALFQPPHFVAEVAAVLARESRSTAEASLRDLLDIEMTVVAYRATYARAVAIAIELDHHVFDTLYHAVALATRGVLVTADRRYLRKARALGGIVAVDRFTRDLG